ncbi:Type I restriction enzyme R protein N terminus (HSDR_N) [Pseudomonas sp. NFIX10]|uniref:type I restriction enzyme HsdR N-terminal domain-containing protein n=1 Tax=unclassified Pseudomonas TaxID=196821 RepID=UPI0008E52D06|nr:MULTISPECIES: type I restriction endonuclease [unclassified Pseudomonas]SFB19169.1 Type I restriction enzyme R protein N terminus (HSDR_N) [Pseudomonas sp. NFIX10]SFE79521.1 Type I restriction enzyme R protein N terminus (HSDR_N) [Pseudomonas sp. NFACC06-1]
MTVQQLTTTPTETDLEAEIHAAIRLAFPLLPAHAIRHQIQFSFKFGHATFKIDGQSATSARARADVVLYMGEKPLAVLELKREGESLLPEDGQQGLSYAQALNPSPPLVVVTNGSETRYLETHTRCEWVPADTGEQAFFALMDSASTVAKADLKLAIQTLMGTNPTVWMQAVHQASNANMDELTGDIEETDLPFSRNFLIPRRATLEVIRLFKGNQKLILLEGSSLVGKSNVLRELCEQTAKIEWGATFYIETETGSSILQSVADALEEQLNWPVTPTEARSWLKQVSQGGGPDLILAIDGLNSDDREVRKEIEDLSSSKFGQHLKLVVALDTTVASRIVITKSRSPSPIGRRAVRVEVEPLDDNEYAHAVLALLSNRLALMQGAFFTPDYRNPWVLRSVAASTLSRLDDECQETILALLPMLNTELIQYARDRFDDIELRGDFAKLAQAMMIEARDTTRHPALAAEWNRTFAIRRTTVVQLLSSEKLSLLAEAGYLKLAIHQITQEEICYVRQPALLASEVARVIKSEIITRAKSDPEDAATWLTGEASHLPLGDVIAAHALFEAATGDGGLPTGVIFKLLTIKPRVSSPKKDSILALNHPGLGYIKFRVISETVIEVLSQGLPKRYDFGEPLGRLTENLTSWQILSHVCGVRTETMDDSGNLAARLEPRLLLEIAAAPMPLLPSQQVLGKLPTHDLSDGVSIVCHAVGIVEPITQSLFTFLRQDLIESKAWVELALTRGSGPLLARIHIALGEIACMTDPDLASWARDALTNQIVPALTSLLPGHEGHFNAPPCQ